MTIESYLEWLKEDLSLAQIAYKNNKALYPIDHKSNPINNTAWQAGYFAGQIAVLESVIAALETFKEDK